MKNLKIITSITMLALLFNACKKPADGAIGPQGNQGPQGTSGNANVTVYKWNTKVTSASTTASVTYSTQLRKSYTDSCVWHFYIANDTVTSSNVNWYPMPGTYTAGSDYFRCFTSALTNPGKADFNLIRIPNLSLTPSSAAAITIRQAKLVIIPPGLYINLKSSPIDWSNYEEVKKRFNIKDEDEILMY
jgi:hypothetical protein